MGLRFRKSFKIAPGVRVNVGKKSVGISAGVKGARVSVNSNGRVTKTVGLPGTGVSYVTTSQIGGNDSSEQLGDPVTQQNSAPAPMQQPPQGGKNYTLIKALSLFLIAVGLLLSVATIAGGLVSVALGCFGLHWRANRIAENSGQMPVPPFKKRWQIGVAVAFVVLAVAGAMTPDPISDIKSDGLVPTIMEVPEAREVTLTYSPSDASTDKLECSTSNDAVATASIKEAGNGKIICLITPVSAGNVTISCHSGETADYTLDIAVTDPAAEEAARIAAEEAAKKAAEEKAAAEAAAKAEAKEQQSTEQTVYITPSGKRWHLDPSCGGKNSYSVDISEVGSRTPCKKCAEG